MNQRLSTCTEYLCTVSRLHDSVSLKDSLDSQLEEAKLSTVKRTYVTLNWVDRRRIHKTKNHTNVNSSNFQLARRN